MKTRGRAPELQKNENDENLTPVEAAAGIVQAATQDVELALEEAKGAARAAIKKIRRAMPSAAPANKRRGRAVKPAVKKTGRRIKSASTKPAPRKSVRRKRRR